MKVGLALLVVAASFVFGASLAAWVLNEDVADL